MLKNFEYFIFYFQKLSTLICTGQRWMSLFERTVRAAGRRVPRALQRPGRRRLRLLDQRQVRASASSSGSTTNGRNKMIAAIW